MSVTPLNPRDALMKAVADHKPTVAANYTADPAEQTRELAEAEAWADDFGLYEAHDLTYQRGPVSLTKPPASVTYRRKEMRENAIMSICCAIAFVALVWLSITPDPMVEKAQAEASQ